MSDVQVACYSDKFHNWSMPALAWFEENPMVKNSVMIVSGFTVDFVIVFSLLVWVYYCRSWRFPLALSCIYLLKLVMIGVFAMRMPYETAWHFPGWYSLSVSYGESNHTHFTLHVAILVACFCEQRSIASKMLVPTAITLVGHTVLILVLRGCYLIDIFAAVVFGTLMWNCAEQ